MYCKTYFIIIFLFYFRKYKLYPLNLTMVKVQCSACDKEMRKNQWELERHWQGTHLDRLQAGEKPEWKIPSSGTSSIASIFKKVVKDIPDIEASDENSGTGEVAVIGQPKPKPQPQA
jgi:hypothetical protein